MINRSVDPLVPTGAMLALLDPDVPGDHVQAQIQSVTQRRVVRAPRNVSALAVQQRSLRQRDSLILEGLGIAILPEPRAAEVEGMAALVDDRNSGVVTARPEYFVTVAQSAEAPQVWKVRYEAWLKEAALLLSTAPENYRSKLPDIDVPEPGGGAADSFGWGLLATGVDRASVTGSGVRIAVIDTGVALTHPAFADRDIKAVSFVPYENSEDRHGHGTHCFGVACGGAPDNNGVRYGIATGAEALSAKCLDATGTGRESWILAGVDWALGQNANIVSMSLGLPYGPDGAEDPIYTRLGEVALESGCLIVAATGNGSNRPDRVERPLLPAAASTILSVGALAEDLSVAPFSNGSNSGPNRQVDLLAPGVNIYSTHLLPIGFRCMSGTSMATPHVSGIACLFAESDPALRGQRLWDALITGRRDLGLGLDAAGVVQAPAGT